MLGIVNKLGFVKQVNSSLQRAAHQRPEHFNKGEEAIKHWTLILSIAKEVKEKEIENVAYLNLGHAYLDLGNFKKAIDFFNLHLAIAKEMGDTTDEAGAYSNLGIVFYCLGDFKKARDYNSLSLRLAKKVKDKTSEGRASGNLGNAFYRLHDFKKSIHYHNLALLIAKEVGDKEAEGCMYGNLGIDFCRLGDFEKALNYHNLDLGIAKELGNKEAEGRAYSNLGNVFTSLGNFQKAKDYFILRLRITKELGNTYEEARGHCTLGITFELLGLLPEALENYQSSVRLLNNLRSLLQSQDAWKIDFRSEWNIPYANLWRVLLKQGKITDALFAAEEGRAQALKDLMQSQYNFQGSQSRSLGLDEKDLDMMINPPLSIVYLTIDDHGEIPSIWVLSKGDSICGQQVRERDFLYPEDAAVSALQSLIQSACDFTGVRADIRCEDRSMDVLRGYSNEDRTNEKHSPRPPSDKNPLSTLYDVVIKPIAEHVQGNELIIVPDGPLWLAPYAAFLDSDSKYLCESFKIRVIPSLTSLKLITDCPDEYHRRGGALLVGDPWVAEVTSSNGKKLLEQLPFARKEVEMIGEVLKEKPLIGKDATKDEVLKRLSSVALVHIAAHGCIETGEIALTPNPKRRSKAPTEEDYVLTMKDVLSVQLRAKLVVLSCCHSGRGEIKAEGVVGIARAFMGAGARSVLVSLWAIDDEATLEFMRHFYHYLVEGRSASESLNLAMKCLRESEKYSDVKYWAPFVLIGDDVTLEFGEKG